MKIKKNTWYIAGIVLILVIGIFMLFDTSKALASKFVDSSEVQVVKLSVSGGNYILEPSELRQGVKVKLEADMTKMPGCSKSIVIPSFGVSKIFTSTNNVVEFVPNKAGTFNIACSMNMYRGTFTVLESYGSKSNYVEQKLSATGGSCGASGGGCGCGGMR